MQSQASKRDFLFLLIPTAVSNYDTFLSFTIYHFQFFLLIFLRLAFVVVVEKFLFNERASEQMKEMRVKK